MEVAAVQHRHEATGSREPREERLTPADGGLRFNNPETNTHINTQIKHTKTQHNNMPSEVSVPVEM